MRAFKEGMMEWIFILFTTLLLPCFLTLLITGTKTQENTKKSGIMLEYEDGKEMDLEEFLPYMIAGEIDLEYEEETLKAQAVIARTNLMRELGGKKEAKLKELSLAYLTPEQFQEGLGKKAKEKIWYKLEKAVEETCGQTLRYQGEHIEALYHGISLGNTVSAEEVFGKARPYLISVTSSQDVEATDYMEVKGWSKEEALQLLQKKKKAKNLTSETLFSSIQITEKTEHGYVKQLKIGEETMTGEEWKEIFTLASANFYLEEQEGDIRMITLGKGHGIGLSQYGANCMAKEKYGYEEILEKYYPGTSLQKEIFLQE